MVSLVMMALAFGVPKPPCSGPAQNVTSGKLALTFYAFLKARIHKFSSLSISCESQFAMAAEYLKIGIMVTYGSPYYKLYPWTHLNTACRL